MLGAQFTEVIEFISLQHNSNHDVQITIHNTNIHNHPVPSVTPLPPLPPLKHSSTFFVGRDKYLQRLKDYFSTHVDEGQRKSFLLYGLGGIDKTQICLRFIEQNSNL